MAQCPVTADNSYYRHSGCWYDFENCPIKGKKNKYKKDYAGFLEQVLDGEGYIRNEVFDFNNKEAGLFPTGNKGAPEAKARGYEQSMHDGHFEGKDLILVSPPNATSDRAKWCTDSGGKLAGVGPDCDVGEKGTGRFHQCYFDKVKDCEAFRQDCMSKLSYTEMNYTSGFQGEADMTQLPVRAPGGCDERFYDCRQEALKECVCDDCLFDVGSLPGNGEGDIDTPPGEDDDNEYSEENLDGPQLTRIDFSSSAYDIPIPLVYGTYIVPGNVIWISEPRTTIITKTTEATDSESVRVTRTNKFMTHIDMALALAEGPVANINRVWFGDMLVFNRVLSTTGAGQVNVVEGAILDEIENVLLFSNNDADLKEYDKSRVRLRFFSGDEDQTAPAAFGFGAPAYRGMAYLLLENLNVTYMNGTIPQIRVELIASVDSVAVPFHTAALPEADLKDLDGAAFYADVRSNSLYITAPAASGGSIVGLRRLRLDTLEEITQMTPSVTIDTEDALDGQSLVVLPHGAVVIQSATGVAQRQTYLLEAGSSTLLSAYGSEGTTPPSMHLDSKLGICRTASTAFSAFYVATQSSAPEGRKVSTGDYAAMVTDTGGVKFMRYDVQSGILVANDVYVASQDILPDCFDACQAECYAIWCPTFVGCNPVTLGPCINDCHTLCDGAEPPPPPVSNTTFWSVVGSTFRNSTDNPDAIRQYRRSHIDTYALPDLSKTSMKVRRVVYADTFPSGSAGAATMADLEEFDIPATDWGGETDGISGLFVLDDVVNAQHIVFLAVADGRTLVLALRPDSLFSVAWQITLNDYPHFINAGPRILPYPATHYQYVGTNGRVMSLDMASGDVEEVVDLTPMALPPVGGGQFYDPARGAVTYISTDAAQRIVRVYPSRVIQQDVSVGHIIRDVAARAGIPPVYVDVSELESFKVAGISVNDDSSARSIVSHTAEVFGLKGWQQDGTLKFASRAVGDLRQVSLDDLIVDNGAHALETVTMQKDENPAKVVVTYANLLNMSRPASQSISGDALDQAGNGEIRVTTPYALDASQAMAMAERIYVRAHANSSKAVFSLPSSLALLMPNDFVDILDYDGIRRIFQIEEILLDPQRGKLTVQAVYDNSALFAESASLVGSGSTDQYEVQREFARLQALTPRAIFALPYTRTDMLATKTHYVVYLGVEAIGTDTIQPVDMKVRALNDFERVHLDGPRISEPLHTGVLVSPPLPTSSVFDTDVESVVQVRFRSAATGLLLSSATSEDLFNDTARNALLVNREWIQFKDFEISPTDPRTVTFRNLLRGRFGSDTYIDSHVIGEEVIYPTVGSFRPYYIQSTRLSKYDLISIRLGSPQTIQVQGAPVAVRTLQDSIRPWALTNHKRYISNTNANDIVVTGEWRSKHTGELIDNETGAVIFEPTEEVYDVYRTQAAVGAFTRKFIVYFSRLTDSVAAMDTIMRNREEFGLSLSSSYQRAEAYGDVEATFTATMQTNIGFNKNVHTLYVYTAQLGGPGNDKVGFISRSIFPPGTYDLAPFRPKIRARKVAGLAVLGPPEAKVHHLGWMVVLRP